MTPDLDAIVETDSFGHPLCADCGKPGYITDVGTQRVVGHLDQRIKHTFRLTPDPDSEEGYRP